MSKLYNILNSLITRVKRVEATQPDFSQNDPTASDYVKNRTHYEETVVLFNEPLNITWDGNTEGLVHISVGGYFSFYKISDLILNDNVIKSITETTNTGYQITNLEKWDNYYVTEDIVITDFCAYVRRAGAKANGITFSKTGIYSVFSGNEYTSSITTTEPIEYTKTIIHKLDNKFLPGSVKYVNIIDIDSATADATYEEIAEWIASGYDVKCVFNNLIFNLAETSALSNISTYESIPKYLFTAININWEWGYMHYCSLEFWEDGDIQYIENEFVLQ